MSSIKTRIVLEIGEGKISRPRELQRAAGADEHHVVHVLYSMQKQGIVAFGKRRSKDSPGLNLYDITLTPTGITLYKELRSGRS